MGDGDDHLSMLLSSAGIVVLGGLVGSGIIIGERIVIGQLLTPSAYGEVTVGLAVLTFSRTLSLIGFANGIPRYMSRFDDVADRRGIWLGGLVLTGCLSLLIASVLAFNVEFLTNSLFERSDSPQLVKLFVAAVPFAVGLQVAVGSIRGMQNTLYKTYTQDLLYPVTRIILISAMLVAGMSVLAVGYAYLAAAALTFVIAHLLLNQLFPLIGTVRTHNREVLRFSLPVMVSGILGVLLTRTDTLMLAHLSDSFEVGLYGAAYPIASGMLIVLSSFGFMYLPLASKLDADGDHEEINRIYKTTTKWIFLVTFPAFLTFVLFPADVIQLFFGSEYIGGAPALVILSFGFFANAVVGRNRETMSALGKTGQLMGANALAFALNFALNLVLIPRYGLVGAAAASAASYLTLNLAVSGLLFYLYDISPISNYSVRTFVAVPLLLFPPMAVLAGRFNLTILLLLPFLAAVGLLGLVVTALVGGFQPEDRIVIEFVEEAIGVRVPLVRRYLPAR